MSPADPVLTASPEAAPAFTPPAAGSDDRERLELALEVSGIGTWDWDLATDTLLWDARCRQILGYPGAVPARFAYMLEIADPRDRARLEAAVAAVMRPEACGADGTSRYDVTLRIKPPARGPRWVHATGRCFFDTTLSLPRARRFVGTLRDVTEWQSQEDERLRLAEVLDQVGDALVVFDRAWRVVAVNAATETMAARGRGALIGATCWALWPHLEGTETAALLERVMAEQRPERFLYHDTQPPLPGIHERWIEIDLHPGPEHLTLIARDVSARVRAEQALVDSEERFRLAAEGMAGYVYDIDVTRERVERYGGVRRLLGYAPHEIEPSREWWRGLVHPDDVARFEQHLREVYADRACDRCEIEYRIRHRAGHYVWVCDRSRVLRDARGWPVRIVGGTSDITARKQMEASLAESEQRFRLATEAMAGYLYDFDLVTGAVTRSKGFEALTGYALEEAPETGAWWQSIIHPDDLARLAPEAAPLLADPACVLREHTYRIRHRDGAWRWIHDRARIVRDAEGRAVRMVGGASDVTARVEAEQARDEALRRIERIATATPDILYVVDLPERRNRFANRELTAVLGYSAEEVQAMGSALFETLVHPEDLPRVLDNYERLARAGDGEVIELEYRMRHREGAWRWLRSRDVVFSRSPGGAVHEVLGLAQDITARREAEEALQAHMAALAAANAQLAESEDHYRHTVELNPQVPWLADAAGNVVDFSARWLELTGLTREDALGGGWATVPHPDDVPTMTAAWSEALATGGPYDVEHRIRLADGSYRWMRTRAMPRRDSEGRILLWYGTTEDIHDRKLAEAALAQSEERYRLATEAVTGFIYDYDLRTGAVTVTSGMAAMIGLPSGHDGHDAIDWIARIHPDDRDLVLETFGAARERADVRLHELRYRVRHEDGRWLWVVDRARFLRDEQGAVIRMVGGTAEITQQREAEAERDAALVAVSRAQAETARLQGLTAQLSQASTVEEVASVAVRVGTAAVGASMAAIQLLTDGGTTFEMIATLGAHEAIVREWRRFPHDGSTLVSRSALDGAALFIGDVHELGPEWDHLQPGLALIEARAGAAIPLVGDRGVLGALWFSFDTVRAFPPEEQAYLIAIAQQSAQALERAQLFDETAAAERRYRALAGVTGQLLWLAGSDGGMREPGAEWLAWTGLPRAQALGMGWLAAVHEDDRLRVAAELAAIFASRAPGELRLRLRRHDGVMRRASMRVAPLADAEGVVTEWVCSHEDAEDRLRADEQLRQARHMQAVGTLAGGVAHEVNNQMTVVLGFGELLRRRLTPAGEAREDLDAMLGAAGRAAQVAQQLLAFSRRQLAQPRRLALHETVRGLVPTLVQLLGPDKRLLTQGIAPVAEVIADPVQVEQILINLVVNARDALAAGGEVALLLREQELDEAYGRRHGVGTVVPGAYARLTVRDTGSGMSRGTLARVFEPFFTTKPVGRGTGLGLSMVYGIVKQSGGFVWIESEEGQGTTVHVDLPLAAPRATRAALPPPVSVAPRCIGLRALVVDDEPAVALLVRRALQEMGAEVRAVESGAAALALVREGFVPELLVTDVVMPEIGGAQLAERLLVHAPALRVLFVSGFAGDDVLRRRMIPANAPFLQKPFRVEELQRRLQGLVGVR